MDGIAADLGTVGDKGIWVGLLDQGGPAWDPRITWYEGQIYLCVSRRELTDEGNIYTARGGGTALIGPSATALKNSGIENGHGYGNQP